MKTKEEIIKEAYSSVFNELPPHAQNMAIRNNGYISTYFKSRFDGLGIELETTIEDGSQYFRPKSLQGIENNNGWVKIESEDDLPIPELNKEYYFIILEKELNESTTVRGWADKTGKYFINNQTYSVILYEDMFYKVTHYQPIVKPNKPLY